MHYDDHTRSYFFHSMKMMSAHLARKFLFTPSMTTSGASLTHDDGVTSFADYPLAAVGLGDEFE